MTTKLAGMPRHKKKTDEAGVDPSSRVKAQTTDTVRVDGDLARKITMIATRREISVSELLSPYLRPWVEELYRLMVREMSSEIEDKED